LILFSVPAKFFLFIWFYSNVKNGRNLEFFNKSKILNPSEL
jgi:hypothetical protein